MSDVHVLFLCFLPYCSVHSHFMVYLLLNLISPIVVLAVEEEVGVDSRLLNNSLSSRKVYVSNDSIQQLHFFLF